MHKVSLIEKEYRLGKLENSLKTTDGVKNKLKREIRNLKKGEN